MRLAACPMEQPLSRAQWLQKFSQLDLKKLVAVVPEGEAYPLDANWSLIRVGSFWRQDEEYHVYAMKRAVLTMAAHRDQHPGVQIMIVTPVWVFKRVENRAQSVGGEEILQVAERNFMRFFDEVYKRWKTNG